MKKTGLAIKIEADSCSNLLFDGIGEFIVLTILYIKQLLITKKFDWGVLLIFGMIFIVLLMFFFVIWFVSRAPFLEINTLKDEIIIRKLIRKKKYNISELNFKAYIQADDEIQFIYKLMIYKNNKKIIHIYNTGIKNNSMKSKEFYKVLRNHLEIEHIINKVKNN